MHTFAAYFFSEGRAGFPVFLLIPVSCGNFGRRSSSHANERNSKERAGAAFFMEDVRGDCVCRMERFYVPAFLPFFLSAWSHLFVF